MTDDYVTTDPLVGTFVGRYRVTRLLGKGGMGRVYLAVQPDIGSRVAIKLLSEEWSDSPEATERFFREAQTVNLIRHEHIIMVLDLDRLPNGRPYIVMEYVDGTSLRDVIEAGPAPLGGVAHVMSEVLLALAAAHEAGVVHRDLKPDNVMLTPSGHAKVLDFGIAKLLSGRPHTRTGTTLGTPHYMAPEQILGGDVDARSDIYAAGIMLFELATGRRPFDGATDFHLMESHLRGTPPSARALRASIPHGFEAVIAQAIAKEPAARFQSARAMAYALRQGAAELAANEWQPLAAAAPSVSLDALPAFARDPTQRVIDPLTAPTKAEHPTPEGAPVGRLDAATRDIRNEPPSGAAMQPAVSRQSVPALPGSRRRAIALAIAAVAIAGVVAVLVATRQPESTARHGVSNDPDPGQLASDAAGDAVVLATVGDGAERDAAVIATISDAERDAAVIATVGDAGKRQPAAVRDAAHGHVDAQGLAIASTPIDAITAPKHDSGDPATSWDGGFAKWADYAPAKFDASHYLARAQVLARMLVPDATLAELSVPWVYPDGHVELDVSENPSYEFRSASGAQPCVVLVMPNPTTVTVGPRTETRCKKGAGRPRCSVAQILARAKAMGAAVDPAPGGGYGPRNFVSWDGAWHVTIRDKSHTSIFDEVLDDNCP